MNRKSIQIILCMGEKEKWCMLSGKFMARDEIKGYDILPRGDVKTLTDDRYKTNKNIVNAAFKFLNKTAYNEIIIYQEDTICFHIFE